MDIAVKLVIVGMIGIVICGSKYGIHSFILHVFGLITVIGITILLEIE